MLKKQLHFWNVAENKWIVQIQLTKVVGGGKLGLQNCDFTISVK
mgnify:CR=1 FL=1